MSFSTEKIKVETGDGHNVLVVEAFTYTSIAGKVYEVPAGATSDGLSIPRALWDEFPPFGTYWMAGVLHDHLYRGTQLPKDECDQVFREAMLSLGVKEVEANLIYDGVRFGGWKSFEDDRKVENAS